MIYFSPNSSEANPWRSWWKTYAIIIEKIWFHYDRYVRASIRDLSPASFASLSISPILSLSYERLFWEIANWSFTPLSFCLICFSYNDFSSYFAESFSYFSFWSASSYLALLSYPLIWSLPCSFYSSYLSTTYSYFLKSLSYLFCKFCSCTKSSPFSLSKCVILSEFYALNFGDEFK